jgi:type IV pilus assembly protein PilA
LLLAVGGALRYVAGVGFLGTTSFGSSQHSREIMAIESIRMVQQAEMAYESTYPANGFACTFAELGGDPSAGAASPHAAQILRADINSGSNPGYIFSISCPDPVTRNGMYRYDKFAVTAVPKLVGKTGTRGFCGDQFGNIQYDPAGGANCTQPLE